MIKKTLFGKLSDGKKVFNYSINNNSGMRVNIINYGAIVKNIFVKDKNGNFDDVVLGCDNLEGYIKDKFYLGAIVGRYANRINKGKFNLEGKDYQLTINDGENHLHGGFKGFHKVYWNANPEIGDAKNSIKFTYISPDGEEGYPGTLSITVTYTITNENEFKIKFKAVTDKISIINSTHHSYFNLTGDPAKKILDHNLSINAEEFTPVNKKLITTGKFIKVENTPMDFRSSIPIGLHINDNYEQLKFADGYDHNWVLNNFDHSVKKAASLYEPQSGRFMEVYTDQPGIQFYSGNFLDGTTKGKNNLAYQFRTGLCLETQHFPDTPNKQHFSPAVLEPSEVYRHTVIYKFSIL